MPHFLLSPAKSVAVVLFILSGCAASCNRAKPVVLTPAAATAIKTQVGMLRDSVDVKWNTMTASDDQKINITRLLLQELEGQPSVNATQVQALEQANARLKTRRYDQQTMASSALIDQYDAAQDSLLKAVYPVAAPNGNAPTESARNFVEGIQQIDATVVGYRVQYDRAAKKYNEYVKTHQPELESLGGKYAEMKPLPLFELAE